MATRRDWHEAGMAEKGEFTCILPGKAPWRKKWWEPEFPDDHRRHVPCCQSLPVTKVLRLGRVTLPELHYPGVGHVGKQCHGHFPDGMSKDSHTVVLFFPQNPEEIDPGNSTSPTSVPSMKTPTCFPNQSPRNHSKLETLSLQGAGVTGRMNKKLGW